MNSLIYIILVILILILISCKIFKSKIINTIQIENFQALNSNIEIVVSRYNEDVEWMYTYPFNKFKIICYNKGPELEKTKNTNISIFNIPNVGRCDHTYLYHIIKNYDNLANNTIFLPASCLDERKLYKTNFIINKTLETSNTVFLGVKYDDLAKDIFDFNLTEYICQNPDNVKLNPESELQLSPIRPFGLWYSHNFGNIKTTILSYYGIFSINKSHILSHSKEYYSNLASYLDTHSNPEVGHYFERAWAAIFYPIQDECFYYE